MIGWLPIVYYNRVASVPEYFERRFDRRTRFAVLIILLVYLQGYVGVNLLTIGQVLEDVLEFNSLLFERTGIDLRVQAGEINWGVILLAAVAAVLSGLYLHAGGQTSVLMTDLAQGLLLLTAGLTVVFLGIAAVGGILHDLDWCREVSNRTDLLGDVLQHETEERTHVGLLLDDRRRRIHCSVTVPKLI